MKDELENIIPIKIAISLTRLLAENKTLSPTSSNTKEIANSYNKICLNSGLRKATVSDIFNAKSINARASTLILIIEGMGYKFEDFAKIYDMVNFRDIKEFSKRD